MSDAEMAERLYRAMENDGSRFTPWEMDFIEKMAGMAGRGQLLSPSQRHKLEEIYEERM